MLLLVDEILTMQLTFHCQLEILAVAFSQLKLVSVLSKIRQNEDVLLYLQTAH